MRGTVGTRRPRTGRGIAVLAVVPALLVLASVAPPAMAQKGRSGQPATLGAAAADSDVSPSPLTPPGVANLTALARLYGVVRFFHPSDEAAAADWDRVVLAGVEAVEGAADGAELARELERLFRPLAPTLRVGAGEAGPDGLAPLPVTGRRTVWRHDGVQAGDEPGVYSSRRLVLPPEGPPEGSLKQFVDASALAGEHVRWSVAVRAAPASSDDTVGLRLTAAVAGEEGEGGGGWDWRQLALRTVPADGVWRRVAVQAGVPEGAVGLELALVLRGSGRAELDDVRLERAVTGSRGGGEEWQRVEGLVAHGGFEDGLPGLGPLGWSVSSASPAWVHRAVLVAGEVPEGRLAVRLERHPAGAWLPQVDRELFDLGAGVWAALPLALPVDDGGATLPRPEEQPSVTLDRPEGWSPSVADRTTRLAGVLMAWTVLHHFYPYFDLVDPTGERWARALPAALEAAAVGGGADGYETALARLLVELDDGHAVVTGSGGERRSLPLVLDVVGGKLVVTWVDPEAGLPLSPGDEVVAVDGEPAEVHLDRLAQTLSAATPQWRLRRVLRELRWGPPGERVELTVRSRRRTAHGEGGGEGTADERKVTVPHTAPAWGEGAPAEPRPEPVAELEGGVLYVDLSGVDEPTFDTELERIAAADAVIFDLRGYPRLPLTRVVAHLAERALSSARWRVPRVVRPRPWVAGDRGGMHFGLSYWTLEPAEPHIGGRVVFLTDGRAISAAETLMGIVEHYRLAQIVGGATAGTNGNVNRLALPGDLGILWTGMRVTKHDGTPHHGVGVLPTVPVTRTVEGVAAQRDEVLERGVEVARGLLN